MVLLHILCGRAPPGWTQAPSDTINANVVGAAGAEPQPDLTRVFLAGTSCAMGSRTALGLRLTPLGPLPALRFGSRSPHHT